jgi:flavin-dependent dehydrogenase
MTRRGDTTADVVVIGGGIAGGAVAAHLAHAGRRVVLLEREAGLHHKVCGEFVSGEAMCYLRGLDIDLASLGAVPIAAVNIHTPRAAAGCALPFPAVSISRRTLDDAVLRRASAEGAEVRRGHAVRSLHRQNARWIAELGDGGRIAAGDAFLATGKHDLRGWRRPPGRQNDLIAFKMHWRAAAATGDAGACVELFFFPGGYAGIEPVEGGVLNLCLAIRRGHFVRLGGKWEELLSMLRAKFARLRQLLDDAEALWPRPLAVGFIPYGFVQSRNDGPWRLGDQAAVIPSFSGDGIAIALHSARMAADYYLLGRSASEFQAGMAHDVAGQVRRATLMSSLLVRPEVQAVAMALAQMAPGLVGQIGRGTRIPGQRLLGGCRQNETPLHPE